MLRRDTGWEMRSSLSKRLHFIGACRQAKAETFCRAVDRRRYRGLRPFQTLIGDVLSDNSAALKKNIFSINSSLDIMLQCGTIIRKYVTDECLKGPQSPISPP